MSGPAYQLTTHKKIAPGEPQARKAFLWSFLPSFFFSRFFGLTQSGGSILPGGEMICHVGIM